MRSATFVFFGLCILADVASADNLLRNIRSLCHRRTVAAESVGSAMVRPWPINHIAVDVQRNETQLGDVLARYDTLSAGVSLTIANFPNVRDDPDPFDRLPFLYRDETPQTLIYVSNSGVLVIPRIMLLHPLIRSIPVSAGDLIIWVDAKLAFSGSDTDKNATSRDEYWKLLPGIMYPNDPDDRIKSPDRVSVFGALANTNSAKVPSQRPLVALKFNQIEKSLQSKPDESSTPVFVLHRTIGQTRFRYVQPFQNSGLFSEEGLVIQALMKSVRKTKAKPGDLWLAVNQTHFTEANFIRGDRIEVTHLPAFLIANGFILAD